MCRVDVKPLTTLNRCTTVGHREGLSATAELLVVFLTMSNCRMMLAGPGEYSGMQPVQSGTPANIPLPLPDLSKPPPGFPPGPGPGFGPAGPPPQPPPLMSLPLKPPKDTELMPSMPYYDLPAGLMAPLVKVCDV